MLLRQYFALFFPIDHRYALLSVNEYILYLVSPIYMVIHDSVQSGSSMCIAIPTIHNRKGRTTPSKHLTQISHKSVRTLVRRKMSTVVMFRLENNVAHSVYPSNHPRDRTAEVSMHGAMSIYSCEKRTSWVRYTSPAGNTRRRWLSGSYQWV